MRNDVEIKSEAFQILFEKLGSLEAERFVSIIQRSSFNYTKWKKNLPQFNSIEELSNAAMQYRRANKSNLRS
jgi:hypothetical protein